MSASKRRPKGTGFVRERGNSRLLVVTINGKQYSRAIKTATKREAQAMLSAFIAEVRSGQFDHEREAQQRRQGAPTFDEFAKDWLTYGATAGADGAETRWAYDAAIKRVAGELGTKRVSEIGEDDLRRALRGLHDRGSSVATIRLTHSVVGKLIRAAEKRGFASPDTMPKFADLHLGRQQASPRNALTEGQLRALIAACDDPELELWCRIMIYTGCRPGEALGLSWGNINFPRDEIEIEHAAKRVRHGQHGVGRLGATKTRQRRTVPMASGLRAEIETYKLKREAQLRSIGSTIEDGDLIFAADPFDARKVPRSPDGMLARFKRASQRASLIGVTPHWLRHSALTKLGNVLSVIDVAAIAGHSNIKTTSRYMHSTDETRRRGVAALDAALNRPSEQPANVIELKRVDK